MRRCKWTFAMFILVLVMVVYSMIATSTVIYQFYTKNMKEVQECGM